MSLAPPSGDFWVLISFVQRKFSPLSKSSIALVTSEWPVPRVRVHVLIQILRQREGHVTVLTHKWPLVVYVLEVIVPLQGELAREQTLTVPLIALEDARCLLCRRLFLLFFLVTLSHVSEFLTQSLVECVERLEFLFEGQAAVDIQRLDELGTKTFHFVF